MKFYLIILIILLFIWPLSAQPYRLFIIEGISSKMNGDYREKERRIKDFTNNGNFYRSYFQEEINMTFSGTFYHPNLMTYNSSLGVNLNQGKFASENSTLSDNPFQNSFFGDMSISTLILPKKPANLRINYNKNNRRINRSIYENIDQKFHNITLSSQFRIPFFPLTVSGGKSNSEDDLLLDRRIIREEENFRIGSRFEDLYKFDGNVDLIIKNQLREDNNGQHRQSRNLYRFNLKFPDKKTISAFNTGVNILYSQNKSNISSNNINLTQHNAYKFSDDLNINCKYSYQNNQYEKSENNLVAHNMSLNIRHNFYSSLVSEASLKASQNNSNEQKSNNIKIPLQWNYSKYLPFGRLFIDYGLQPVYQTIKAENRIIYMSEINISFNNGDYTIPKNLVDPESIIVRSSDNMTVYTPDLDYLLIEEGDYLSIRRIPNSNIPENDFVILEFHYRGAVSGTTLNKIGNFGISYQINSFYDLKIAYRSNWNKLDSQDYSNWWIQDERSFSEWSIDLNMSPLSFEIKHENSVSEVNPYSANTANFRLIFGSYISQYLRASAGIVQNNYELNNFSQNNYQTHLEYFRRFSSALSGSVTWNYRQNSGDISESNEKKLLSKLVYNNQKVKLDLKYEKIDRQLQGQKDIDWRITGEIQLLLY